MIRILLVDDQNLVQQGIKSLLEQDQNFKVIGTVKDGKSAIKQISLLHPDIVLLDIEMPGMNGITLTKYINHFLPEIKVIILSSHEEKKYLVQALVAGASSYILKNSLMKDLKQAILAVDNGYSLIESRLLAKVLNSGTVKLVPVKSGETQKTVKSRTGKSGLDEHIHDESDLVLVRRDEASKSTVDQPAEDNLMDEAPAAVPQQDVQNSSLYNLNSDEPSYFTQIGLNEVGSNIIKREEETDLVPFSLALNSSDNHNLIFGSHTVDLKSKIVAIKNYFNRIYKRSEIQGLKVQIVQICQLILTKLSFYSEQYKPKLIELISRRSNKKTLSNLGLMLLGLIVILFISSL